MDGNIIALIVGGVIGLLSGIVVQIVSSTLNYRNERRKFLFSKLEEIISSISEIEECLQHDIAQIYGVNNPNTNYQGKLSYEQKRLECLVGIYHPKLNDSFNSLHDEIENYFSKKRQIVQKQRANENVLAEEVEALGDVFYGCTKKIESFIGNLTKYGAKEVR